MFKYIYINVALNFLNLIYNIFYCTSQNFLYSSILWAEKMGWFQFLKFPTASNICQVGDKLDHVDEDNYHI